MNNRIRLYWWHEKRASGLENYGDLLSKYLVEKISGKKVVSIKHPLRGIHKYFFKNYVCIGSIISSASKKSIVWGSGIIKKNDHIREATFVAVRGPKTRSRILELGYDCPEVYGDPAILLPNYYHPKVEKKYKIGIIPHYVDYEQVNKALIQDDNIKVINLLTKDIEKTTQEILECEQIISSSLHGVILPQAYRIPSLWVKFSDKLSGDNIKFHDYFESMSIHFTNEIFLEPSTLSFEVLNKLLIDNKDILLQEDAILENRKETLLASCPFAL
ncbi:MAG: polysaccharide pyruvyl transferase family protein [Flavobacteriaceae bacterium]|nr:polysaccharide pyruvyl transferase family protein [Flavobacteriaceae bacterium]